MKQPNPWTAEELDILIKEYPRMKAGELMKLLPGRTLQAIYSKARSLALSAYDNTETDRTIRRLLAARCSLSDIARHLGCYCSAVRYRAIKLGLINGQWTMDN